jgi:preprotein translocase subunit SecD
MQGNGFKIGVTLFFVLLSGYYLYPTAQNYFVSQKLESLEGEALKQYEDENYTRIRSIRERSLSLGLDLQGGMHATLELQVPRLIRELARDSDEAFEQALKGAPERVRAEDMSVVEAFMAEFEEQNPDARLSRYFRNSEAGITRRSTNEEVAEYLETQASEAIDRAISIVRDRIDRFGVTEPSIQKQGTRRITVELPGVEDRQRVRDLLEGTAQLQFRLMANPEDLAQSLQRIIEFYQPDTTAADVDTSAVDTSGTAADTTFDISQITGEEDTADGGQGVNPLLDAMQPVGQSVIFGAAAERDTARVRELLSRPEVQQMLPTGVELMWRSAPEGRNEQGQEIYYLLGVREEVELAGDVITDARVEFDQQTNEPRVSMTMNAEGTRIWARLTGANVGRPVAIVMDDVVYSYPRVQNKIPSGRSSITGLESSAEAEDIVTVLQSGALPAPLEIIEERAVGPSLGAQSVRAGTLSLAAGFLLVVFFMGFYYRTAGLVANVALLLNMLFIFGILAGFNATLTLPGIAGIVLTIGMAVDANVLIFERIREEQSSGKTLAASIEVGYSKALSAIADANITTFFVGVILYSFGVGPIQGFAVTLMAGILSSLFTAIVVTRILFDWMVRERRQVVSYG